MLQTVPPSTYVTPVAVPNAPACVALYWPARMRMSPGKSAISASATSVPRPVLTSGRAPKAATSSAVSVRVSPAGTSTTAYPSNFSS